MFDKIRNLVGGAAGSSNPVTSTLWTTPWAWRREDGVYKGYNGHVWVYRALPLDPIEWEDDQRRLALGRQLHDLLVELGETSKALSGQRILSRNREIHIVSVAWQDVPTPPEGTPEKLAGYFDDAFSEYLVPRKAVMIGVRLRPKASAARTQETGLQGLLEYGQQLFAQATSDQGPEFKAFEEDLANVSTILSRHGCRVPDKTERGQLESWYNLGRGPDAVVYERKEWLEIDDADTIEVAAVMDFEQPLLDAPHSQWIYEAETHGDGPHVVSVRAELEPPEVTRSRSRTSQRRINALLEEEAKTGDLEHGEYSRVGELAKGVEEHFTNSREALLTNASLLMARRQSNADETYIDYLRGRFGIQMKPLEHRQLDALDETLPCSSKRVNPFLQDLNLAMLAYAGVHGFSELGDSKGVLAGLVHPDFTPCYVDPLGAPAANQPPGMGVLGQPGAGKTYFLQSLALQSSLAGLPVILVNPKGFDTLAPFAEAADGQVIHMTQVEERGGAFDPFRFAPPEIAAEIATQYITDVMGDDFDATERRKLMAAMKRGARVAAASDEPTCVMQALQHLEPEYSHVRTAVKEMVEGSSLFGLGIGTKPQPPLRGSKQLTLIEFDRDLDLPEGGVTAQTTITQRIALNAVRLTTRAALWMLAGQTGGVLIVDEAWTFLSQPEALADLQRIGRLGRSLNILPIFATQRIADVVGEGRDLESFISRWFVMQTTEEREAKTGLEIIGLEPTKARIEWLADCGPRPARDGRPPRWAAALHKDLDNRHAVVSIGPTPRWAHNAFTTNPEERRKLREAEQEQQNTQQQQNTGPPPEAPHDAQRPGRARSGSQGPAAGDATGWVEPEQ